MRTYRAHYIFEISCYMSFLALSLNSESSLKKLNNYRIQIRIQIFTKIESIRPCHTSNMSTKFHSNPSTFFEISCYILVYPYLSMMKNHFKIIRSGFGFGSSPKLNQFFLVTHPMCPRSFVRIRLQLFEISCYISFWPHLSMVKNHEKNSSSRIRIQIFTKI